MTNLPSRETNPNLHYCDIISDSLASSNTMMLEASEVIRKATEEIDRLKKENERLAHIVKRIYLENFPNTWFTCGEIGNKDENGLPEMIQVCPAYGVDWSAIYKKDGRIIGGMGS